MQERWFPPTLGLRDVTVPVERLPESLRRLIPGTDTLVIPVESLTVKNDPPARTFENGGIGLRLGGTWNDSDWNLYHYAGPATRPNAQLESSVRVNSLEPPPPDLRLDAVLRQANSRLQMTGFDFATVFGSFAMRLEAAYSHDQVYLRTVSDLVDESVAGLRVDDQFIRDLFDGGATVPCPPSSCAANRSSGASGSTIATKDCSSSCSSSRPSCSRPRPSS